jgi:chemotaxis protein histidine kinase CheA
MKKAGAALMAVTMALSCASCGENTANALNVSDYDVRAGIYLYYATSAFGEAVETMRKDGANFDECETTEDYKKIMKAANLDGVPVEEWIQNKAEEYCATFVEIEQEFDALGLTLTGEQIAEATSSAASSQTYYGEFFKDTGIGEKSIKEILLNSYKQDALWNAYYGEGGKKGIEEQTLYDYYADNTFRIAYIEMPLKDGEGNLLKADGKKVIEDMANDFLKRLNKKKGDETELMEEFNYLYEENANYVTSVSEAAVTTTDEEGNTITTPTTAKSTTDENGLHTTTADEDEDTDTPAKDEDTKDAADNTTETTTTQTVEEAAAEKEEKDKDEDKAEDKDAEDEDKAEDKDAEDEDKAEDKDAEDEDKAEDKDAEDDDAAETEPAEEDADEETVTEPVEGVGYDTMHEVTIQRITTAEASEENSEETTTEPNYIPCEKVYNWAADENTKYLTPEIIKDDECYYVVIKLDIHDRMVASDLWGSYQIESVRQKMYQEEFIDMLGDMADALSVTRNNAAFRRYKVLDIDYVGYQNALMQSYYSRYGYGG